MLICLCYSYVTYDVGFYLAVSGLLITLSCSAFLIVLSSNPMQEVDEEKKKLKKEKMEKKVGFYMALGDRRFWFFPFTNKVF